MFIHLLPLYIYSSITFMLFFISKLLFLSFVYLLKYRWKNVLYSKKRSRLLSETGTFFDFFCF